ncbi:MAG: thiamine-phosphate kinase [bacterium]
MAIGEFNLIRKYFHNIGRAPGVVTGVGDDAAVVDNRQGYQLVAAQDTLVAGVHFPQIADAEKIASRALRVNLSDFAAMGADPKWFTLGLTLPAIDQAWLCAFSTGLAETAEAFQCELVGGDTTRGSLNISIAMFGEALSGRALLRSGARPGDQVYVTGDLGQAAAALAFLSEDKSDLSDWQQQCVERYYFPQPRLAEGKWLQGFASAAIDISDGLMADAGHIASGSGVGVRLFWDQLPIASSLRDNLSPDALQSAVLSGGDDYELCFTIPEAESHAAEREARERGFQLARIGEVVAAPGGGGDNVCCLDNEGKPIQQPVTGYDHFADLPV